MSRGRVLSLTTATASIVVAILAGLAVAYRCMPTNKMVPVVQGPLPGVAATAALSSSAVSVAGQAGANLDDTRASIPPRHPSSFYGTVTVNAQGVQEGTLITVGKGHMVYAQTTTSMHEDTPVYRVDVPADDPDTPQREGGTEGEVLEFTVGGFRADQTAIWRGGSNEERSLTAEEVFVYLPSISRAPQRTLPPGLTPTNLPTPTSTDTPAPAPTDPPAPTNTPTDTPAPTKTPTNTPAPTNTPSGSPTSEPGAPNPSSPAQTAKLVFVHASVGEQWLGHWLGNELGANNYFVSDYSIHNHPDFPGHDYCAWWDVFSDESTMDMLYHHYVVEANYSPPMADPGGENNVIMIKPCFLQYPIYGYPDDPPSGQHGCPFINLPEFGWQANTVGNVKQALIDVLEVLEQRPDKFFVLLTAPPKKQDAMTYGENARAIANWMLHEWLDGYEVGNVMVFDLFNVLTSNAEGEGDPCQPWDSYPNAPETASDVGLETGNHHRIWDGSVQHQIQYDQNYSAYCWSHPPKQGTYKMTQEFVPLLNARYNAWIGGG